MKMIALLSLVGGTGRTTLAAHLAALLAERLGPGLAVDVDPQNALGLHFGVRPGDKAGLLSASPPRPVAKVRGCRAACMPFGYHDEASLVAAEREASHLGWLQERLASVTRGAVWCLLDTPAGRTPWTRQALASADLVVVVLRADAVGYASVPATLAFVEAVRGDTANLLWLVNAFDELRPLSRDVLAGLRDTLGESLLPTCIADDEAVREAAAQQALLADGVGSQAARAMRQIADRLAAELAPRAQVAHG